MVSNRLTHRRTTISNPKICKSKLKPLRPLPPEPPPQWPPPYINARISALVYGQQFEASVKLLPQGKPPVITYFFHDYTLNLRVEVDLYTQLTPQQILFARVENTYSPSFFASYGGYASVQPPTFRLEKSQWAYQYPDDAQIVLAIAYPHKP